MILTYRRINYRIYCVAVRLFQVCNPQIIHWHVIQRYAIPAITMYHIRIRIPIIIWQHRQRRRQWALSDPAHKVRAKTIIHLNTHSQTHTENKKMKWQKKWTLEHKHTLELVKCKSHQQMKWEKLIIFFWQEQTVLEMIIGYTALVHVFVYLKKWWAFHKQSLTIQHTKITICLTQHQDRHRVRAQVPVLAQAVVASLASTAWFVQEAEVIVEICQSIT